MDLESPTEFTGVGGPFPQDSTRNWGQPVWRALVLDGCENPPPVIPVEFRNEVDAQVMSFDFQNDIGVFEASDDTSLVPTGYWIFEYTVRATSDDGADASDFLVRGTPAPGGYGGLRRGGLVWRAAAGSER